MNLGTSKPTFLFGASNQNTALTPAFSFGSTNNTNNSTQPAFGAFGSSANLEPAKPFSFGGAQSSGTTNSFGAQSSTTPASNTATGLFGTLTNNSATNSTTNAASPFGAVPVLNQSSSAFGSAPAAPNQTMLGLSGFGATNTAAPEAKAGLFGSSTATNKPAATGGLFGTPTPSNTGSGFAFGQTQSSTSNTFPPQPTEPKQAAPAFKFGQENASSTSIDLLKANTQPSSTGASKDTTPAFLFGKPAETDASKPAENARAAPAFGNAFGALGAKAGDLKGSTPFSLSLGSSTPVPAMFGDKSKPAVSFAAGSKPEDSSDKPAMFGNTSSTTGNLFGAKAIEGTANSTTEAKPSFLFGVKADEKKTEEKAENKPSILFGGQPELKSDSKPAFSLGGQSTEKADSKPGFLFGAKPEEKSDKPTFSFGAKSVEKSDKPAFSLGAKPEEKTETKPGFSFGAKANDKPEVKPGFSFGAKPEDKSDDKCAAKPGFSFGAKPEDKAKKDETKPEEKKELQPDKNAPTLKPTLLEPVAVSLDNKTLEDLIMMWSKQLTKTKGIFDTYTGKVKTWDQQLTNSAEEISKLHKDSSEVETLQKRIDQQLLFVESQQDELDQILDSYELQADVLLASIDLNGATGTSQALVTQDSNNSTGLNVTDKLREKAYHNAELLDERLDSLGENLSSLVSEINNVSDVFNKSLLKNIAEKEGSDASGKSIEEIVKLLNLHLDNLKYIESTKDELEAKVKQLQNPKPLR